MSEQSDDELRQTLEDLREYRDDVREEKAEAVEDGDNVAAAYAAGKEAGVIAGIAAMEELVDDA